MSGIQVVRSGPFHHFLRPANAELVSGGPFHYPVRVWTGLSEATATRFSVLRTTKCDAFSEARRTKNRLLRYGMSIRCKKRPPGVRDASSEAFGVKNRRFWYGRDIQCAKKASCVVRDAFGDKKGLLGYAMHFQRPAEQPTPQTVDSLLPQRQPLQCAKRPPLGGEQI